MLILCELVCNLSFRVLFSFLWQINGTVSCKVHNSTRLFEITVVYYRNLPFGLAPGIGLSAYLTYGLILGDGLSRKQAFTAVR